MPKRLFCIICIMCTLQCIECTLPSNKTSYIESVKWELIEDNKNDYSIKKGEYIEFNKASQTCTWGCKNDLSYFSNDSLLLINEYPIQRVFKITLISSNLKLEEMYCLKKTTLTFKEIKPKI